MHCAERLLRRQYRGEEAGPGSRYDEVLAEVDRLRAGTDQLPERSEQEETVTTWNVREALLDTGHTAAVARDRWDDALRINADIVQYKEARGAMEFELARKRYDDYGPLLSLQRYPEARRLLHHCRDVFERHNSLEMLGKVFSALADLEDELGHGDRAIETAQHALRYSYVGSKPGDCAISHFNLATYLRRAAGQVTDASLAHRLAAAVIRLCTRDGRLSNTIRVLASQLTETPPSAAALLSPDGSGFEGMCELVERVEGVRFRELIVQLAGDQGPAALARVLAMA